MKKFQIAVDGPASSGKSTVAKLVAQDLGLLYLDTGAMYRAATYVALRDQLETAEAVIAVLEKEAVRFKNAEGGQLVFLGDEDVTSAIRQNDVTNQVSKWAAEPAIRDFFVAEQRKIAEISGIIMDGRDIGTVVLPEADLKIYLIASVDERAERRYKENLAKGIPTDLTALKQEIAARDEKDMNRKTAPLKQAEDAVLLDSTGKTIEQVVEFIEEKAKGLM
ncbi:(d)CMP kinase [Lactococcus termiticola]|uniref:Cytidylate kinase n=1 Tax=Lactococcus termiticola TaxID=2169526 RepID=A0A2R5HL03_9LACT|nr:(d)CMP kinase [Lactococcus termiticola]GBG97421.1 cytidylate kinase [Lactococcus termiticola]